MKRAMLNFCFHNPNSIEATADCMLKSFIEVNKPKIEQAIRKAVVQKQEENSKWGHSL